MKIRNREREGCVLIDYIVFDNGTATTKGREITQICALSILQFIWTPQVLLFLSRKYIANNHDAIRESQARITVRECENSSPIAIATFNYGVEKTVDLKKMGAAEIDEAIKELESYSQHLSKTIKIWWIWNRLMLNQS